MKIYFLPSLIQNIKRINSNLLPSLSTFSFLNQLKPKIQNPKSKTHLPCHRQPPSATQTPRPPPSATDSDDGERNGFKRWVVRDERPPETRQRPPETRSSARLKIYKKLSRSHFDFSQVLGFSIYFFVFFFPHLGLLVFMMWVWIVSKWIHFIGFATII